MYNTNLQGTQMISQFINKLNESDSRLHKEKVLKQALELANLGSKDAQIFLGLTKACYNPYNTWGVKQVPETQNITGAENPWSDFNQLLISLHNRALTGHAARDKIEALSLRFDSDEWNLVCRPVLRKDLRAGISDKTINKICKKTPYEVPVFGCQLATNNEGRPEMSGKKRLEPKLDGARMLLFVTKSVFGDLSVVSYSRNGKVYENFTKIEEQAYQTALRFMNEPELKNGYVLDGEVMGASFQELMTQARRKTEVDTDNNVFHVFDIIPVDEFNKGLWNKPLSERIELIEKLKPVFGSMDNFALLTNIEVDLDTAAGRDQYNRYCNDCVNSGYEGVMIKDMTAPYECKRTLSWMKMKPTYNYDLTVVSIEEGEGKHYGRLGAFVCEGIDEASNKFIRVNVGSGYTDEERIEYFSDTFVGRTIEVTCDAITQDSAGEYSLRFPRFCRIRDDK